MPTLNLPHGDLFYAHHSQPDGRFNLALIHGAGHNHLVWPPALRRLPHASVYALDLPGHGRSGGNGRTRIEAYAADVVLFLEKLALSDVVLFGHSMGGAIVQQIGLNPPAAVQGLILLGTGAKLRVAPAFLDGLQSDFATTRTLMHQYSWADDAPAALKQAGLAAMQDADPDVVYGDYLACDRFDLMAQLGEISLPTLVISGADDQMTPLKYGRFLARHIPHAQLEIIEGGGHMMALEQPDAVVSAVSRFLETLPAPK